MCSTAQVRTEVIDPGLSFPEFPDPIAPDGHTIPVLQLDTVLIPEWYWIKIVEYVVDVEKVRKMYESWQEIYTGEDGP
jgi:hypothetical protein